MNCIRSISSTLSQIAPALIPRTIPDDLLLLSASVTSAVGASFLDPRAALAATALYSLKKAVDFFHAPPAREEPHSPRHLISELPVEEPQIEVVIHPSRPSVEEMRASLSAWAGENANRQEAARRILDAFENNRSELNLAFLKLDSLPPYFGNLVHLTELKLNDNRLTNLIGIESLVNLIRLDVCGNKLTSLVGIENLINLSYLDLSSNRLTSLIGIESLVNLIRLDLSFNKIRSLVEIKNLINLTELALDFNRLTNLSGIENLVNLTELVLDDNRLTSLVGIENLVNLTELGVCANELTSLAGIENLINLVGLRLANNRLTDLTGLTNPASLTTLNLLSNNLSVLPDALAHLPRNCHLSLENNLLPLAQIQAFQARVAQVRIASGNTRGPNFSHSIYDPHLHVSVDDLHLWLEKATEQGLELNLETLSEDQRSILSEFLSRILHSPEYSGSAESVDLRLIQILNGIHGNEAYRETAFAVIANQNTTCIDGIAWRLVSLEVPYDLMLNPPKDHVEYALRLIGHKRFDLLNQAAWATIRAKKLGDAIETLLHYQTRGTGPLSLPSTLLHMAYQGMSGVSDGEIDLSIENILSQTSSREQHIEILCGSEFGEHWAAHLEKTFPAEFDAINAPFHEELEKAEAEHIDRSQDILTRQKQAIKTWLRQKTEQLIPRAL